MPQTVNILGVGDVEFPDEMSNTDIESAIKNHILPQYNITPSAGAGFVDQTSAAVPAEGTRQTGGFFTGTGQAFMRGLGTMADIPGQYGAAFGSEESFQDAVAQSDKRKREQASGVAPMNLAAIIDAYNKDGLFTAATKIPQFTAEAVAGSAPFMAAPLAAAATAQSVIPPLGIPGLGAKAVVAASAFITTSALQFFGLNIGRQIEEGAKTQNDLKVAKAALAAPVQAGTDYLLFLVTGLFGRKAGSDVAERAARSIAQSLSRGGLKGGAVEMPAEISQQLLERWQAGLSLTSPDALNEYAEAGAAALAAGGFIGGVSQTVGDRAARRAKEEEKTVDVPQMTEADTSSVEEGPLQLPAPPPVLLLEDHSNDTNAVINPDQDVTEVAQETLDTLGSDLPLAFNKGEIITDETGAPVPYEVNETSDGIFVQTKDGVRASPNFSTPQQAEVYKSELNFGVQEILEKQDAIETDRLANEAVEKAKPEEREQLLAAARQTTTPTTISFSQLDNNTAIGVNKKRINLGQKPLVDGDVVSVEELSDAGVGPTTLSTFLPPLNLNTTTGDIEALAEQKNIEIDEAGFERFAARTAGNQNYKIMSPTQLNYLSEGMQNLPTLPGATPQPLPTIRKPIYNASQYATAVASARNMEPRPDKNLLRGEVLSSDVNKSLGQRGAPSQAIIDDAVRRGDLIPSPRRKRAYIHKDHYGTTPLARGEIIDQKARQAARLEEEATSDEAIRRDQLRGTTGIIIRRSETDGTPEQLAERTKAFRERIAQVIPTEEAVEAFKDPKTEQFVRNALEKRMRKYASSVPKFDSADISLRLKQSIIEDGRKPGKFEKLSDGRMIITLATDSIAPDATPKEAAKQLGEILDHEIVHVLRELNIINETDWKLLTKFVKKRKRENSDLTWHEEAERYRDQYSKTLEGNALEEAITEEAIADAFMDWAAGRSGISGKPASIFRRIVDFFLGVKEGLTHAELAYVGKIFETFEGQIERRAPGQTKPSPAATEADPDAGAQAEATRLRQSEPDIKFSIPRQQVNRKDSVFTARNEENDNISLKGKAVPPKSRVRRLSVVDILYNPEFSARSKRGVNFVGELLRQRGLSRIKQPIDIANDRSKDNLLSDVLALEYKAHVANGDRASGWYSQRLTEAVDKAATLYPELATDPNARFAFLAALAITSQNTDVQLNTQYAIEVYDQVRNNNFSAFPIFGKGKHASSMESNFMLLNSMIENMGGIANIKEFFDQQFTVEELERAGFEPPTGEARGERVYGSYLLGPKIGQGFYQNLNGNFDPVTIDMWLMRTFGRLTGTLVGNPGALPKQIDRLYKGLLDSDKNDALVRVNEAIKAGDSDSIIEIADELRLDHDRLFKTPEVRKLYDADRYEKPEWAKAAEAIVTQQLKPRDQPSGPRHRQAIRRILGKTLAKLEADGISTNAADLQAVLWYPEKTLYGTLGVKIKDLNLDYSQAMDEVLNETQTDIRPLERGVAPEPDTVTGRGRQTVEELGEVAGEQTTRFSIPRKETTVLLDFIRANPEGFTVRIDGKEAPSSGYVVAPVKAAETTIAAEELTEGTVEKFAENLEALAKITNQEIFAGGWFNKEDGKYYLDGVHIYDSLDNALYVAEAADQIAIFDLNTFEEIGTRDGIQGLRETGAYNDQSRNDKRRDISEFTRRFEEARDKGGARFSIPREPSQEQVAQEAAALNTYIDRIGTREQPVGPNAFDPSSKTEGQFILNGRAATVYIPKGYNRYSGPKNKSIGFGKAHADKHLDDVVKNTPFNSIEQMLQSAMTAYWPVRNNPKAGGFEIREKQPAVSGLQSDIVMEWTHDESGFPSVFIFQPVSFAALSPEGVRQNPSLANKSALILKTAWAGPSDGKSDSPAVMPITNPVVSSDPQMKIAVDRGINDAARKRKPSREVLHLRKRFSIPRSKENATEEVKKAIDRNINTGAEETFFDKIMSSFKMTDLNDHTVWTKARGRWVRSWAGVDKRERQANAKRGYDIMLDSSASAMFSLLSRKAGIVAAGLTKGPMIRDEGRVFAVTPDAVNHWNPIVRQRARERFERLADDTAYTTTDPVTGEAIEIRYVSAADVKGLVDIFSEIDQQGKWMEYFLYAAAVRAQRLRKEGREKTMSISDQEIGLKLGLDNPSFIRTHQQYQLWNNATVNVMKDSGVITEVQADLWKENADYLPFYRELYDDEGANYAVQGVNPSTIGLGEDPNNSMFGSFYHVPQMKELKGGKLVYKVMINNVADSVNYTSREGADARLEFLKNENPGARVRVVRSNQKITEPLEGIIRNFDAAITSSLQNMAVSRAVRDLGVLGMARRVENVDAAEPSASRITLRVAGEARVYEVDDPMLSNALQATAPSQIPLMGLQTMPANILRELVTKTPEFMAANMMRDTLSAWTTSGANVMPIVGTLKGFGEALLGTASVDSLIAGGAIGGYEFKGDAQNQVKGFKKHLKMKKGFAPNYMVPYMWEKLNQISSASDTSTRVAVYNSVLKETAEQQGETAAIIEAIEVINFSSKGSSPGIRYITAVVPFLNAKIQGLDVLYRGATGTMNSRIPASVRKRKFYTNASIIVAATMFYSLMHMADAEDEEADLAYKNADEFEKDNYWIFPFKWFGIDSDDAFRFPIPFEVGLLFKVIPERIANLIVGQTTGQEFIRSMKRGLFSTLEVGLPQFMAPFYEVLSNKNSYTDRDIVPFYRNKQEGWMTDPRSTTEISRDLSRAADSMGMRIKAEQIDHLIRGYTGTYGTYAMMAADSLMRNMKGLPDKPDLNLNQTPVIRRFLQGESGRGLVEQFYEIANEVDIFTSTLNALEEKGMDDEADDYRDRHKSLDEIADEVKDLRQDLKERREDRKEIFDSDISSEEKRILTNEINREINALLLGFKDKTKHISIPWKLIR